MTTGEVGDWTPVWGLFVTPEGFAGTFIRAVPEGGGAVVNLGANSKARVTAAFTYRDSATHPLLAGVPA